MLPRNDKLWRELAAAVAPSDAELERGNRWQVGRLAVVAAVLMLVVGAALVLPAHHMLMPGPVLAQLPELDAGAEASDAGGTVDVHQDDGRDRAPLTAEKTLPKEPEKGWARPPCAPGLHAINGACWLRAEPLPLCPAGTYRHTDGRCYAPVARGARAPTSVDP